MSAYSGIRSWTPILCLLVAATTACIGGGGGSGGGKGATNEFATAVIQVGFPGDTGGGSGLAGLSQLPAFEHFATYSDVVAVSVEVTNGDSPVTSASLSKDPDTGVWAGEIAGLPIGQPLSFIVSAVNGDAPPVEVFSGSVVQVLTGNDLIVIELATVPGPAISVPRIVSVTLLDEIVQGTSASVYFEFQGNPGETLTVTITPAGSGGSFTPSAANVKLATSGVGTLVVLYIAPSSAEAQFTHRIRVTNSQGNSVAATFLTNVVLERTSATVNVHFNPVVVSILGERSDDTVIWEAEVADDRPLDELAFAWDFVQATGVGTPTFSVGASNPSTMTGYEETVSGEIRLAVTDLNGLGGTSEVTIALPAGQFPDELQGSPELLTVDAFDRGWWNSNGVHDAANQDTFTGNCCGPAGYRSYFQFDLSAVPSGKTVIGAELRLDLVACVSCDEEETVVVWDVTTDSIALDNNAEDVIAVFEDLGSGAPYAQATVTQSAVGSPIGIVLGSQAISDINARIGSTFAVGLNVESLRSPFTGDEGLSFGGNEEWVHELVLILR